MKHEPLPICIDRDHCPAFPPVLDALELQTLRFHREAEARIAAAMAARFDGADYPTALERRQVARLAKAA